MKDQFEPQAAAKYKPAQKEHVRVPQECSAKDGHGDRGIVEMFASWAKACSEARMNITYSGNHLQALSERNSFVEALREVLQGAIAHSWGPGASAQSAAGTWRWVLALSAAVCCPVVDTCTDKINPQRLPVETHVLADWCRRDMWLAELAAGAMASVRTSLVRSIGNSFMHRFGTHKIFDVLQGVTMMLHDPWHTFVHSDAIILTEPSL
jgi:hypothetical protein